MATSITERTPAGAPSARNPSTIAVARPRWSVVSLDTAEVGGPRPPAGDRRGVTTGAVGVGGLDQHDAGRAPAGAEQGEGRLAAEPGPDLGLEARRAPGGPGNQREPPPDDLPAEQRRRAGHPCREAELLVAGLEVRVHVGERLARDQVGGVVGGRAALAGGELAGQPRDDHDQQHRDADGRAGGEQQAPAGARREPSPRARDPLAGRADRASGSPTGDEREVGDRIAQVAEPAADRPRPPRRRDRAHRAPSRSPRRRRARFGTRSMISGTPSSPKRSRSRFSRW